MASRRGRGDGTICKRKDGRYDIAVIDPVTGKRYRAYARTVTEAQQKRRDMLARIETGTTVLDSGLPLVDFTMVWLEDRAGRRRRPSTVREYKRRLNKYVVPSLGKVRLRDLTMTQVEDLFDDLAASGLSKSTLTGVRNALAALLADAVAMRQLRVNAARLARLPEMVDPPPLTPVGPQAVGRLLAEAEGTELHPLLTLIAHTGCRIGEALALKWTDLDLSTGLWRLQRTLTVDLDGAVVLGTQTKSGGMRVVGLSPEVIKVLRTQRASVRRDRLRAGRQWVDHDLVFPTAIGTPQDPHNARKALRPLTKAAGFDGSFHALRHFMVSVAASSGAPLPVIAKVVGHKRISTTADLYAHLLDTDAARVTSAVSYAVNQAVEAERERRRPRSGA